MTPETKPKVSPAATEAARKVFNEPGSFFGHPELPVQIGLMEYELAEIIDTATAEARQDAAKLREELRAMTDMRDTYAQGFSEQSRLHGKFAREAETFEQQLTAALAAIVQKDKIIDFVLYYVTGRTDRELREALAIKPDTAALDAVVAELREEEVKLTRSNTRLLARCIVAEEQLAAQAAVVEKWQDHFEDYGWHGHVCPALGGMDAVTSRCDCGFSDLICELQRQPASATDKTDEIGFLSKHHQDLLREES